jgi:hypothetical protein
MKIKSIIEIPNQEKWLKDIEFIEIREKEKYILRRVREKLNIVLSNIRKNDVVFFDEIKFGQFEFCYYVPKYGRITIRISLNQQSAARTVFLDNDQWISYLHLLPHQVFHSKKEDRYPIVRRLSEWDELRRIENWVNTELEDWVLNNYKEALQAEGIEG